MTRATEVKIEKAQQAKAMRLWRCAESGLLEAVERCGGELRGFSVKLGEWDCLLTLRADFPSGPCVGFVGGETLGGCLLKAQGQASKDAIKWRPDNFKVE